MKSFFDRTIKAFLIVSGLGTCVAGLFAFLPQIAVEKVARLPFVENHAIIVQHWGMMVLLMGILMIVSAFKVSWRMPILTYSIIEKSFMVILYIFYRNEPFVAGFQGGTIMDVIIVVYLLLFFWKTRSASAEQQRS